MLQGTNIGDMMARSSSQLQRAQALHVKVAPSCQAKQAIDEPLEGRHSGETSPHPRLVVSSWCGGVWTQARQARHH